MNFKPLFITVAALAFSSCAQNESNNIVPKNGIMVHKWEVGCDVEIKTSEKYCYAKKDVPVFDRYENGGSRNTVKVSFNKTYGLTFDLGLNDNAKIPGSITIDDNSPITYKGQVIKGEKSDVLLNEIQNGKYGNIETINWKGSSNKFKFNTVGFKQAYAKMMKFYEMPTSSVEQK